jgi:hypothetical protein
MKAVVDRFEKQWAVLLLEGKPEPLNVLRSRLPRGVHEGDHLDLTLENEEVVKAAVDKAATAQARQRIADKLDKLRRGDHLK